MIYIDKDIVLGIYIILDEEGRIRRRCIKKGVKKKKGSNEVKN